MTIAATTIARGGAWLIEDAPAETVFTPEKLGELLLTMLSDLDGLRKRSAAAKSVALPDAAEKLADLVERTARQ